MAFIAKSTLNLKTDETWYVHIICELQLNILFYFKILSIILQNKPCFWLSLFIRICFFAGIYACMNEGDTPPPFGTQYSGEI